ncbi:hypothetical protein PR048_003353 [Dryococelus australis]|uniref:Uncharacterized protein n=1 Tax=Dryococelus australis TaxID=614101 RepID=A0ABQ9IMS6_9NEOP|nr:hypothetical protein PR048_003353 [Dryococelus australis]
MTAELEWPVFRSEDDAEEERRGGMSDCRNGNTTCTQRRDGSQKESEMDDSGMNNPPNETFEPRHHDKWKLFDHKICGTSSQVRIVGGKEATLGAYPWIARIGYTSEYTPPARGRLSALLEVICMLTGRSD